MCLEEGWVGGEEGGEGGRGLLSSFAICPQIFQCYPLVYI